MRTLRYALCAVGTVLGLTTVLLAFKSGKLLVQANVAGAEVYLQGTLLAHTDANQQLLIEQLPEGTYTIQIKKEGYQEFRGRVTIVAEQTITLPAPLQAPPKSAAAAPVTTEAARAATRPAQDEDSPADGSPSLDRRPDRAPEVQPPAEVARRAAKPATPAASAQPAIPAGGAARPFVAPPGETRRAASPAASRIGLGWVFIAGLSAGIGGWKLYQRWLATRATPRGPYRLLAPDRAAPDATDAADEQTALLTPDQAPASPVTPHGFMRDLRRKEELFEAGFIFGSPQPERPPSTAKASETTIIEVPREEYHYEENSD